MTYHYVGRSDGAAKIALVVNHWKPDSMAPVLVTVDTRGREILVQLSAAEVRDLRSDCATLLDADRETVARWWLELNAGAAPTTTNDSTAIEIPSKRRKKDQP